MIRKHLIDRRPLRRDLLKMAGGCAALTNTSLLSTLFSLSATNAAVAANDLSGYKALVCVFLYGGNDSFNMLSPLTSGEREDYLAARGGVYAPGNGALGLPEDGLHTITDTTNGRTFAIHPAMGDLKTLYDAGDLSFLCNVGSLVEPTTMNDYQSKSNLPLGLFSHADLQRHWMTSVPQTRSQVTGWAGRMADMISDNVNTNPNISMSIALNSVNMLQTGGSVVPYIVTSSGASEVNWYGQTWTQARIYSELTDDVLARSYSNLVEKTFAGANRNALDAAIEFNAATDAVTLNTTFRTNGNALASQLEMVAKTIGARTQIGQSRQIFFVSLGGWDNHDELIDNQQVNLGRVAEALKDFYDATVELGVQNDVVTFTASDFARTLNSNGRGSDHAWGGNQILMGGGIRGNRLHGQYPMSLAPGNALDLGRGRLLPTTSVDELACELAMWYGVSNDSSMEAILPNIRNFPTAGGGAYPIGFLA
ncbi:DUF1501 domain-containing protein [Roseiconus nitratireducens]|uniref:DUF1501 domain-containing protein n=1 Tax=Roseiconus nitratireducens TaxID=2605748 RepID=A0A5M6DA72_9BACT|nr:DUF1501 domain-containing protein [Roseiconus nitratireducens]KAA5544434.1 DUF1501 domain-containing protein [Roseiconus nitratireducens]